MRYLEMKQTRNKSFSFFFFTFILFTFLDFLYQNYVHIMSTSSNSSHVTPLTPSQSHDLFFIIANMCMQVCMYVCMHTPYWLNLVLFMFQQWGCQKTKTKTETNKQTKKTPQGEDLPVWVRRISRATPKSLSKELQATNWRRARKTQFSPSTSTLIDYLLHHYKNPVN